MIYWRVYNKEEFYLLGMQWKIRGLQKACGLLQSHLEVELAAAQKDLNLPEHQVKTKCPTRWGSR